MPQDNRPPAIKNAAPGVAEAADVLRQQAFEMRWKKKMTYQAIAQALGVSRGHAHRLANDGWAALNEDTNEARLSQRSIEVERREDLIASIWDMAVCDLTTLAVLDPEAQVAAIKNQTKAHGAVSKHLDAISRLLGLNAPAKIEHSKKTELTPIEELMAKVNHNEGKFAGLRRGNRTGLS